MNTARRFMVLAAAVVALSAVVLAPDAGKFTDKRDGKTYKKVTIGTQTWMAENLNYDVPNVTTDVCYENKAENCVKHGRLYNWKTALKACPAGWHLPTDDEWTTLVDYVGGSKTAGTYLKSKTGWAIDDEVPSGSGMDNYGFSALPGGSGYSAGNSAGKFGNAGYNGSWWSATESNASYAWYWNMYYDGKIVLRDNGGHKTRWFSVRCVHD